ncbi:hypothetical protein CGZ98_05650 [Enemella evansiae]|nr:hypothetical protein CGZ98_05650 [Enemella evansiae]
MIETATAVDDLLRQLLTMDDRLLTDEQRLHLGELNEQITARLHAHTGIDQADASKHVHGVCTTTWMRERHGYSGPEASGVLREAIRIVNTPVVWEGLAQARVSPRQTTAILTAPEPPPTRSSTRPGCRGAADDGGSGPAVRSVGAAGAG